MKSIIKRNIYAGLGLLGYGTDAVKKLSQELVRKADVSESEGEKIARRLHAKSSKAARSIRKTLDAEVTKVADAIHAAMRDEAAPKKPKHASSGKRSSKKVGKRTRSRGKAA